MCIVISLFLFQLAPDTNEYKSFCLLCLAYQRVDFLKKFDLLNSRIRFTFQDLELLYGFSIHDGGTRELLRRELQNSQPLDDTVYFDQLQLFTKMARLCKSNRAKVPMETSRQTLRRFCYRIRKSENFFPTV